MLRLNLYFIILIKFSQCEWIKISTNPQNTKLNSSSSYENDQLTFSKYEETHSILNKFLNDEPPSKEWLSYQKQRFYNMESSRKFSVYGDQLKTSLQITVPLTVTAEKKFQSNDNFSSPFSNSKDSENDFINRTERLNKTINDKLLMESNNSNDSIKEKILLKRISNNEDFANKTNKYQKNFVENGQINSDKYSTGKAKIKPNKNDSPKGAVKSKFQEFLNFMKSLQNNLITKTALNIKDKIEKLKELRDKLLINIEDRVLRLWPQTVVAPKPLLKREKRGLFEESNTNFPSSETALTTICFLTFAVFLIKLVLQVINTLKSKHYNINGLALNTMEPIKIARNKRNAQHFSAENDYENYLKTISHIITSTETNFS